MFIQNILAKLADGEADTPQLFSAVYTKRYIMKKVASRCPPDASTGRSMVEMLGVLAIIGVLSVGAIAGYSKAMMKYRLNKQAEQLNTVVNAVARNVHSFDNMRKSENHINLTPYFIKLAEIPKEMIYNNDYNNAYDILNTQYYIMLEPDNNWITLYLTPPLATKSEQNLDICRNMIITIKENAGDISYLQTLHYLGEGNNYGIVSYMGDKYCANGEHCVRNMTLDDIYEMCTKHIGQEGTHMKIYWDL